MYTVPSDIFLTSLSQTSVSSSSKKFHSLEFNSESCSPEPLSPKSSASLDQDHPLSLSAYHKPYRLSRKTTLYKVRANSSFVMDKAEKSFKNRVSSSKRKPAVAGETSKFYDQISSHIKSNRLSSYKRFRRKYPERNSRSRLSSKSSILSKPPYLERCYTYTKFLPRKSLHSFPCKRKKPSAGSAKYRVVPDIKSSGSSGSPNISPAGSSSSLSYKTSSTLPRPSCLHSIHAKSSNIRQMSVSGLICKDSTSKNGIKANSTKPNTSKTNVEVRYLIFPDIINLIGNFMQAIKKRDSLVDTTSTQTKLTLSTKRQDVALNVVPSNTAESRDTYPEDKMLNKLSDEKLADVSSHAKNMYDIIQFWLCKIPSHPNEKPQEATVRAMAVQQLVNDIISLGNKKSNEKKYIVLLEDAVSHFLDVVRIYDSKSQTCISPAVKNDFKTYLVQKLLEENEVNEQQQINELQEEGKTVNSKKDNLNKIINHTMSQTCSSRSELSPSLKMNINNSQNLNPIRSQVSSFFGTTTTTPKISSKSLDISDKNHRGDIKRPKISDTNSHTDRIINPSGFEEMEDKNTDLSEVNVHQFTDMNNKNKDDNMYQISRQINYKARMKRTGHIGRKKYFKEIFIEPEATSRDCSTVEEALNINTDKSYVIPKSIMTEKPCLSGAVSVYTSQHDMTLSFDAVTSTPKKKRHPTRLSPEQEAYTEKIKEIIKEWVDASPPNFKYRQESENMNEIMVQDLASEICDHMMYQQIIGTNNIRDMSHSRYINIDTDQILSMYISKWLTKYDVVEDTKMVEPYTSELIEKIKEIRIPDMKRPQYGTRKDGEMIKRDLVTTFTDAYQPLVKVVLEDEISIFMNEFPSEIFVNRDKSTRNRLVHQFAETIEPKIVNAANENDLKKEVHRWINKVVQPREKDRVVDMADSLIDRLKRVPHDETIAEYAKKIKEERKNIVRKNLGLSLSDEQKINISTSTLPHHDRSEDDYDKTLKQFLVDYIEHNHVEEDPLTKRVYANILRSELKRMSPDALKNIYEAKTYKQFDSEKLLKEMLYIKEVSDWLRTIPMDSFYNTVENENRAEFILNVARNLIEIDDEREIAPNAMDYDSYKMHTIAALLKMVPILPTHYNIINSALQRLINRCALLRRNIQPAPPGQNIILFIDEFTKNYGPEIGDDKLKLEAWSARLLKELKSIFIEGDARSKDKVEQRLLAIPKPGDESVKHFNLELNYAKEIVDWLKNVELKAPFDESYIELLANKITDCDVQSPDDENAKEVIINDWVRDLNLNDKDVDVPTLTQQLIKRIKNIYEEVWNQNATESDDISLKPNTDAFYSKLRDKTTPKSNCRGCCPVDDPGQVMVNIVEQWTNKISIKGIKNDIKKIKWDMTAKLEQKIVELSDLYKENKTLYQQVLAGEVDNLFNNLPEGIEIENNIEDLKNDIIENILDAYEFINEVSEGDNYRKVLESVLEKALPQPTLTHEDTNFEALKEYMVDKFLLENFDHAKDTTNLKYKKTIQENIDKFAESAQKRSPVPITTEKLLSELYSSLYKIPVPKEEAIIEVVEEVKTKCEIEEWFTMLQMHIKSCCNLVCQLCENQKFMGLARTLRACELDDASPKKIREQVKLFLQKNHPQLKVKDEYIEDLVNRLNNTKICRKFTKPKNADNDDYSENSDNSTEEPDIWIDSKVTMGPQEEINKPADILIGLVQRWCINLPLPPNLRPEQLKEIRNNLEANIIMAVSKLNSSPYILNSDLLYAHLLNQEIDKMLFRIIGNVPGCDILEQNNDSIIFQLTSAIESVRPLFAEEKSKYAYEKELENIVKHLVKMPENPSPADTEAYEKAKDGIIYNYLQYECNKNSEEGKQFYRNKIVEVLKKYNNNNRDQAEYLIEANRLICELNKTVEPSDLMMREEIVETRMKHEVSKFLDKQKDAIKNKDEANRIKNILLKELTEVEKNGHSPENYKNIENVIENNLKKLEADVSSTTIKTFVDRLKKNNILRNSTNHNVSLPTNFYRSTDRQTIPLTSLPNNLELDEIKIDGSPIQMPEMMPFPFYSGNADISSNDPDSGGVLQENSQMQSETGTGTQNEIQADIAYSKPNYLLPPQQRSRYSGTTAPVDTQPGSFGARNFGNQRMAELRSSQAETTYSKPSYLLPPQQRSRYSGTTTSVDQPATTTSSGATNFGKQRMAEPRSSQADTDYSKQSYLLPPQQTLRYSGTTAPVDTKPDTTRSFDATDFGKQRMAELRSSQADTVYSKPSYLLPPQQGSRYSGTTAPVDTQPGSFAATNFEKQRMAELRSSQADNAYSKPSYLLPPKQRSRYSGTTASVDTQPATTQSSRATNFGKQKFNRLIQPGTTQSFGEPNLSHQEFDFAAGIQTNDNRCCKGHDFKKDIDCDCECCMQEGIPPCLRPLLLPRFMICPYF